MKATQTVIRAKVDETSISRIAKQDNDDILAPAAFRKKLLDSFVGPNPAKRTGIVLRKTNLI